MFTNYPVVCVLMTHNAYKVPTVNKDIYSFEAIRFEAEFYEPVV